MKEILEHIEHMLDPQVRKNGNALSMDCNSEVASILEGDSTRITQVLINLIQNANKFTSHGSVQVQINLVSDHASAQRIRFEVQDTGIGISEADQARLFQPYMQTDQGSSKEYEGTGLGLSICKSLVTLMEGQIGVMSKEGEGSTFWFELELGKIMNVERALETCLEDCSEHPHTGGKPDAVSILLADDNVINRQLVVLQLKKLGFTEVDTVSNGEEAVHAFQQKKYTLILMDNMMPMMDGLEATRVIRSIERDEMRHSIPIIAMTGNVMQGEKDKCFEAGMSDFIGKPFTLDVLGTMIEKWNQASDSTEILNMNIVQEITELNTDGDRTLLGTLLEMYRAETPSKIEDLRRHVVSGDHTAAAEVAHDLKSGSLSLGIHYLSTIFSQIEQYAKEGQTRKAEPLLNSLLPAYQVACESLQHINQN